METQTHESVVKVEPPLNLDKYSITVMVDGARQTLSPLDVAREATQLQVLSDDVAGREENFSAHMVALAGTCESPDEFKQVCEQVSDGLGWGKDNPAPRKWIIYKSTLLAAMKKGVKPGAEVLVPVFAAGRQVGTERMIPRGINQVKRAAAAISVPRSVPQAPASDVLMELEQVDPEASALMLELARALVKAGPAQRSEVKKKLVRLAAGIHTAH